MGWKFGETFIYIKAYLYALVLTVEELRKLIDKSRTKQRGRLMVVYYIQSSLVMNVLVIYNHMRCIIYKHLRGAFGVVSASYIARPQFLFVTYLIISRYTKIQT